MEVRQLSDPTDGDWLELRGMLWDDTERSEHEAEMVQIVAEPSRFVVFLAVASGQPLRPVSPKCPCVPTT